jgi:hypothetical protein
MFSFRPANRTPAHLSRMLGTGFFPSLHFHHTSQWPHQEMISSALIVLLKVGRNKIKKLHAAFTIQPKVHHLNEPTKSISHLQTESDLQMKWGLPWSRSLSPFWLQPASPTQQKVHCFYFWASFNESSTIDGTTVPSSLLDHRQVSIAD